MTANPVLDTTQPSTDASDGNGNVGGQGDGLGTVTATTPTDGGSTGSGSSSSTAAAASGTDSGVILEARMMGLMGLRVMILGLGQMVRMQDQAMILGLDLMIQVMIRLTALMALTARALMMDLPTDSIRCKRCIVCVTAELGYNLRRGSMVYS